MLFASYSAIFWDGNAPVTLHRCVRQNLVSELGHQYTVHVANFAVVSWKLQQSEKVVGFSRGGGDMLNTAEFDSLHQFLDSTPVELATTLRR